MKTTTCSDCGNAFLYDDSFFGNSPTSASIFGGVLCSGCANRRTTEKRLENERHEREYSTARRNEAEEERQEELRAERKAYEERQEELEEERAEERAEAAYKQHNPGDYTCPTCRYETLRYNAGRCPTCRADVPAGYWERVRKAHQEEAKRREEAARRREEQEKREQAEAVRLAPLREAQSLAVSINHELKEKKRHWNRFFWSVLFLVLTLGMGLSDLSGYIHSLGSKEDGFLMGALLGLIGFLCLILKLVSLLIFPIFAILALWFLIMLPLRINKNVETIENLSSRFRELSKNPIVEKDHIIIPSGSIFHTLINDCGILTVLIISILWFNRDYIKFEGLSTSSKAESIDVASKESLSEATRSPVDTKDRDALTAEPSENPYSIMIYQDAHDVRWLRVMKDGEVVITERADGYLLDTKWSPQWRFAAVNVREGNSGDYLWILDLEKRRVLKRPWDPIWKEMHLQGARVLEDLAKSKWDDESTWERIWGTGLRWENENLLIANIAIQFLNSGTNSEEAEMLYTEIELAVKSEGAAVMTKKGSASRNITPALVSQVTKNTGEFSCPQGVYHIQIEDKIRRSQRFSFLTIKRGTNVIYSEHFTGSVKKAMWSEGSRYVAIEEEQESPGDMIRIISLPEGKSVKLPYDERSKIMMQESHTIMQRKAVGKWGNQVVAEGGEAVMVGWSDKSTLQVKLNHFYLPPPDFKGFEILSQMALLHLEGEAFRVTWPEAEVESAPMTESASQKLNKSNLSPTSVSWAKIKSFRLHDNQLFSVNYDHNYISFGVFWMDRIGAIQQVAFVNDVDWSNAQVGEDIERGAFSGATSISIPMKGGLKYTSLRWSPNPGYSSEAPPWSEGVSPVNEEKLSENITVMAADRKSATQLVALMKKFREVPESCKDNKSFDFSTRFPGEHYPQTRSELIKEVDFVHLGKDDLRYAINEMFARHGAFFGNSEVLAMFERYDWYSPMITRSFERIELGFTEHEKENLKILGRLREKKR